MINLMPYGDSCHARLIPPHRPNSPTVVWRTSGFVRSAIFGPGFKIPIRIRNYRAAMAAAQHPTSRHVDVGVGYGAHEVSPEAAATLLQSELEWFEGEMLEIRGGRNWRADLLKSDAPPYHSEEWHIAVPCSHTSLHELEWLLAADGQEGVAIERHPVKGWRWCTPSHARSIAAHPLNSCEYLGGLRAAIRELES